MDTNEMILKMCELLIDHILMRYEGAEVIDILYFDGHINVLIKRNGEYERLRGEKDV